VANDKADDLDLLSLFDPYKEAFSFLCRHKQLPCHQPRLNYCERRLAALWPLSSGNSISGGV
jgi:hypothetical protein